MVPPRAHRLRQKVACSYTVLTALRLLAAAGGGGDGDGGSLASLEG